MPRLFYLLLGFCLFTSCKDEGFITTQNTSFQIENETYQYIGCNYWYGGYIAQSNPARLEKELAFLESKGINNLRVFICGEGDNTYPYRIHPSLQEKPRDYNASLLKSFDAFLIQAEKYNMNIVFVLNNNWEWSGGFGQYLEWAGKGKAPLPKTNDWNWSNYCTYISQFYSNDSCLAWNKAWIEKIVNRKNTINNKSYKNDETIMAWELANEPRPMDSSAIEAYKKWIRESSALIKSIDPNHLITIGTEGVISTFYSEKIYKSIHNNPNIDYATLHLWPKTWQWYNGKSEASVSDTTLDKTKKYIEQHAALCEQINKPLVIEEFGLHRDENSFSPQAATKNRDSYYEFLFEIGQENNIAGYNFWGFAGLPANENEKGFMQKGMKYSADPPQEEQGLYSVFMNDVSTWRVIRKNQGN